MQQAPADGGAWVELARARSAAAGDREGARQARDLAQGWTALHAGLGTTPRRTETSETQARAG